MPDARIVFYDWPHSPFCMKVGAILDYKRVGCERINPLGTRMLTVRRKGRIGKVPALELDGEFIVDSTDIAHALEQRFPQPPIIPSASRERGLCHALEDWADEALYFTDSITGGSSPRDESRSRRRSVKAPRVGSPTASTSGESLAS